MSSPTLHGNSLAHGTTLLWYAVETVLGQGSFGITYLAEDSNLHRWVAIKEFLPGQLARREGDGTVAALTTELAEDFSSGRQRFIDEARTLARFEHPNIVRVHNVFEANGTAYMVMQYEEGEGMDQLLKRRGILAEDELLRIVHPLLDGLATMHAQGYVHRDIKPANIFIRHDGTPVLIDFGSARATNTGAARPLTNLVSPGYAPIEQYAGKSDSQGAWTDIYGLGATLYRAMTGKPPVDAVERSLNLTQQMHDSYETAAMQDTYSASFVAAVDGALRFHASERPASIAAWRSILPPAPSGPSAKPAAIRLVADAESARNRSASGGRHAEQGRNRLLATVAVVAIAVAGIWVALPSGESPVSQAPPAKERAPSSTAADSSLPPGSVSTPPAVSAETAAAITPVRVEQLLYDARIDLEAVRLTSPAGNNAFEKYREVLELAPGNDEAERGIEAIVDRYIGLAYRDIESQRLARAANHLGKAATLLPQRASVMEAHRALDAARTAATRAGTRPADGRGDQLQQSVDTVVRDPKSTQRPTEGTRGEELLKRLGGGR